MADQAGASADARPSHRLPARIWYGDGIVDRIVESLEGVTDGPLRRAFVVTDPGVAGAGHADRVLAALARGSVETRAFSEVRENPTSDDVARAVESLGDFGPDVIVGVGGGSAIDVAKGCAFVAAGGGRMEDYRGHGTAKGTLLPIVAVPTTAGTGTETQSFALIGESGSHRKMACGDPQAAPRVAILDPSLTITQPPFVTACSAIDALGHAIETAVTRPRNALSSGYARDAFLLIHRSLPTVLDEPDDAEARGRLLLAAAFAGIAIENSMLGAAHSMANPMTMHHGIEHGRAVGLALGPVIRFNADDPGAAVIYADLAAAAKLISREEAASSAQAGAAALADRVTELIALAGLAEPLPIFADVGMLAAEAAEQWTARFNPRPVGVDDFRSLFESVASPNASGSG